MLTVTSLMVPSRRTPPTLWHRRRRWSREDKERLVAACLEPGAVLSEIARSAGIHVSQLFRGVRNSAGTRSRRRRRPICWFR
ncbi:transposase [Rhizobium laguerreae]|uniref:transposase n=2 Tax=Rhizobium laguerreae TaxID=1076926 RepID=UPI0009902EF1|nr:transposase [Rhizobium laguerreae]